MEDIDSTFETDILTPFSFAEMLDRLSQSPGVSKHSICDGQTQIVYADFPSYFECIESYFQAQGISQDDCVAFECQNATATLIVLLALLHRGQHLLLLPAQGDSLKEADFKPDIPAFCKTHISVSLLSTENELNPKVIVNLINADPHESFAVAAFKRLDLSKRRLLMRTSGSMGDAKIVQFSHVNMLGNTANCVQRFGLKATSRVMIPVPIFHMYGLSAALIPGLLAGACIDVQANINILRFMEHERRFKPDVVYLNPTLCRMVLQRKSNPIFKGISAGSLLQGSLTYDIGERFDAFFNLYGSTEMGATATAFIGSSMGKLTHLNPMPGVKIEIDPETKALYASHCYCFDGYFTSEGYAIDVTTQPYNTGDIAELLANGCFEVIGRQGNSTNRAGFLVQFADVENALLQTKKVEQAVVLVSQEDTVRGQKLYAFCVPMEITKPFEKTAQIIRKACFDILPKYAVPDEIILLKTFRLLPNGKVDRQVLKQCIAEKNENESIGVI